MKPCDCDLCGEEDPLLFSNSTSPPVKLTLEAMQEAAEKMREVAEWNRNRYPTKVEVAEDVAVRLRSCMDNPPDIGLASYFYGLPVFARKDFAPGRYRVYFEDHIEEGET